MALLTFSESCMHAFASVSTKEHFLSAPSKEMSSPHQPCSFFPLSGTAALEHGVHISVIQAQWALHQQQQCYANPVDSFHLSSLCFFPFSSPSFLLTFAEDPAITLLGYQVQSKMLNNQTTQWIMGKQRPLSDEMHPYFSIMSVFICQDSELSSKNTNLVLGELTQLCYFVYSLFPLCFAYPFSTFPLQKICCQQSKSGG